MEELKKNKMIVYVALAALAFIFIAFLPVVDVMGKGTLSGFKYFSNGEGFSTFLMLLSILAPLAAGVLAFLKKEDKLVMYAFGGSFLLGLLTLLALPTGCSFAIGGWLYLIVTLAGLACTYLINQPTKK